jgi:hypothetical protein
MTQPTMSDGAADTVRRLKDALRPAYAIDRPRPWSTEVLGHTLRVIDAAGDDVVRIGDVRRPGVRELGERIARAGNGDGA